MSPTNLGEIIDMIEKLRKKYSEEKIREMIVYLGDDEELNGIHNCWYSSELDENDEEDKYLLNDIPKEDRDKGIILFS